MEIVRVRMISNEKSRGCEEAPVKILGELKKIKSSVDGCFLEFDKLNLEEIHVDLNNLDEANHLIFENSKEIFERNFKSFFVGGDHTITYNVIQAFQKVELDPLLIIFDSKIDCKNEGLNNESWLRKLVESGFGGSRIILISSRNFNKNSLDFVKENNINLIKMDVLNEDLEGVCDLVMERAKNSSGFYISLDISSLDLGFVPGANNVESGGLSSNDMIYFLKRISLLDNFKGGDIVEVNPLKDINDMTSKVGSRLLAEMIVKRN
jgi:agmatinase